MATTNENKGFYKLSWLQRIGFGSGDLAQNLIFQTTCMYLLFFYTDIYGLDAVDVSVMFTVGNVANVIWDPIVGACYPLFLERLRSVIALRLHHVHRDDAALYLYQCALRCPELLTDPRHR